MRWSSHCSSVRRSCCRYSVSSPGASAAGCPSKRRGAVPRYTQPVVAQGRQLLGSPTPAKAWRMRNPLAPNRSLITLDSLIRISSSRHPLDCGAAPGGVPVGSHARHGAPGPLLGLRDKAQDQLPSHVPPQQAFGVAEVVLPPLGSPVGERCARCKRMYASNSDQTGLQYRGGPMTASSPHAPAARLTNGPGRSSWSEASALQLALGTHRLTLPRPHHDHQHSCGRQSMLSLRHRPSWRGSGRTRGEKAHRHVLPPFPSGGVAPQKLVQNAHSGQTSNGLDLSRAERPSPSHAGFIIQRRPDPIFMSMVGRRPGLSMTVP